MIGNINLLPIDARCKNWGFRTVFGLPFDTRLVKIIEFSYNLPSCCIGTLQFSAEMFVNQVGEFIAGSGPFRRGVPVLFPCERHRLVPGSCPAGLLASAGLRW